jgi:prepilin-type processing-associated H-X9-DG protein
MTPRRNRNSELLIDLVRPIVQLLAFVLKTIYRVLFRWWLDPWLQRKQNQSLLDDIQKNLHFLFLDGHVVQHPQIRVLPFDYTSAEINWENLLFSFTRVREEVSVLVAPRHAPNLSYELGPLVAAVEDRQYSERDVIASLSDAADLLRPRLELLNAAFSEQEFPRTRDKLWK